MWRRCVIACVLAACGRLEFETVATGDGGASTSDGGDGSMPGVRFTYIKPDNSGTFDRFGWAVAISTDGNTVAVAAPVEDGPLGLAFSGSAYVFVRVGNAWSQQAYLRASNAEASDVLGTSIALSGDGNTLALGAAQEDSNATGVGGNTADNNAPGAGAVYVFTRAGTTWSQQAYIKATNTETIDDFGQSVALSGSGDVLAVGADLEDSGETGVTGTGADNTAQSAGAAYVYTRSGITWSPQAYLKASNTDGGDEFGYTVALSADGATLLVGAPGEDSGATTVDGNEADDSVMSAGAAYVFVRAAGWTQKAYLKPSTIDFGDSFGRSITLSRDGNAIAVGAPGEDATLLNSGAVYTFRNGDPTWMAGEKLKAFTPGDNDQLGVSVSLTSNGGDLFIGAPFEDSSATRIGGNDALDDSMDSGAMYVYSRAISGTGWMRGYYGKATNTDPSDNYGYSVAVNGDAHAVVIGVPYEDSVATTIDGDASDDTRMDSGCVQIITY